MYAPLPEHMLVVVQPPKFFVDQGTCRGARKRPVLLLRWRPARGLRLVIIKIINYHIVRGVVEPRLLERLTEFGGVVAVLDAGRVGDQSCQRGVHVRGDGWWSIRPFLPQNLYD